MSEAAIQAAVAPARPGPAVRIADLWPVAILVLLAVLPLAIGSSGYALSLLSRAMIFALAAVSLAFMIGFGGLVSFGHAAFIGIGAYATGIPMFHGVDSAFVTLPLALAASALFGLLTGFVSLRTKGVYFIMITLAFGQMAYFLASSLATYGGDDGMTLPGRVSLAGARPLGSDIVFYYVVFLALAGGYALCIALVRSRFGRVLAGARENPQRMAAVGFDPYPYQLVAYVIAGMLAGIAGFLLANQTEFVSPAFMSWQRSGELIVMVVLGGVGSLGGAIAGALLFLLLEEWLSGLTEHWKLIFGPMLLLVVLFARGGIAGMIGLVTGRRHG